MLRKRWIVKGEDEFYIRREWGMTRFKNGDTYFNCVTDGISTSYIGLLTYRSNFGAPAAVCESLEFFKKNVKLNTMHKMLCGEIYQEPRIILLYIPAPS